MMEYGQVRMESEYSHFVFVVVEDVTELASESVK